MATISRKQDMPPPGGFKPLDYARVPAKSILGGKSLILGHFLLTAGSLYLYALNYKKVQYEEIEVRSSMLALFPMIQAERDRAYLKQCRRNRDEEAKLMANVDGWVVGTYKGEPIYKTKGPDEFIPPQSYEYYIHTSNKDYLSYRNFLMWE